MYVLVKEDVGERCLILIKTFPTVVQVLPCYVDTNLYVLRFSSDLKTISFCGLSTSRYLNMQLLLHKDVVESCHLNILETCLHYQHFLKGLCVYLVLPGKDIFHDYDPFLASTWSQAKNNFHQLCKYMRIFRW